LRSRKRLSINNHHSAFINPDSPMSAIDALFQQLRSAGRKAFMPFVTAGDPDLDFTADVIRRLAARGCSLVELGIPYSDSVADGPVIQASYTRALGHKTKLADILAMVGRLLECGDSSPLLPLVATSPGGSIRSAESGDESPHSKTSLPIVTMLSYSIVFRHGLDQYVADAKRAGIAGAIVPDLPVEEAGPLAEVCRREDFSLIQLITPTTPRDRALRIAERTTGFIYYVSVTGITGERTALPPEILDNVAWLRGQTPLPICIGFGISRPEHVRMLLPVADGLIVGSAIVRRIAEAATRPREQILDEIGDYAAELLAAIER
jgi:tryptophan synthase alpha chain